MNDQNQFLSFLVPFILCLSFLFSLIMWTVKEDIVFLFFFLLIVFIVISLCILSNGIPEGHYSKEHLIVGKEYKVLTRHFCKDWVENKLKTKCHAVISDGKANVYHLVIDDESEKFPEEGKKFFLNSGGKIIELQEN